MGFALLIVISGVGQNNVESPLTHDSIMVSILDTLPNDSIFHADSLSADTTKKDSTVKRKVKRIRNDIETTVNYSARDSIFMDVFKKKAYLYGDAHVDYGKIELEAAYIEIDWEKNEVFAIGMPDTIGGDTVGNPVFKEGQEMYVAKEMRYNFKSRRGIIKDVVTQEGEGYIHGEVVKMNADKELFVGRAQYTTCNLEHPHFAIKAKKIKIIPDKLAVTGPFNFTVADVPTPIAGPFGIFPLPKEKSSGIILPNDQGEVANRGFFMKNFGYYWAVNDYVGIAVTADAYSNGSWRMGMESDYNRRYRFKGSTELSFTRLKNGFDPDTARRPAGYKIYWRHSPQTKKNSSFTSSVNMQSANYNRENYFNVSRGLNNAFTSSIAYSKKFGNSPFRLNVSLRQSQRDSVQNYTLPDIAFNMNRLQPFKRLKGKSTIWYKQIGIAYTVTAKNQLDNLTKVTLIDTLGNERVVNRVLDIDFLNTNDFFDRGKNGIKHSLPLTLPTFKVMKHFTFAPTVSYNEYWYFDRLNYTFDSTANTPVSTTEDGFNRLNEYSANIALTTRLYGYLNIPVFGIRRIKHTATPRVSYLYKPDFGLPQYDNYQTFLDTNGRETTLSRYQGYVMGSPSQGEQQSVSFSLSNVFDAKVKDRKDSTGTNFNYIKLLDNLSASTSYNFAADSLNLSPLSLQARTKLKGISFNMRSTHDFYQLHGELNNDNVTYKRVNKLLYSDKIGLTRLTSFNITADADLNPKKRKKEYETQDEREQLELQQINDNIDHYIDFTIPWSVRLVYNMNWQRPYKEPTSTQSITCRGDVSLTPKWKVTWSNFGYDITQKELLTPQFGIVRDLHCWEMSFQYKPFGPQRGFLFSINARASMLQDLKLSKKDDSTNR